MFNQLCVVLVTDEMFRRTQKIEAWKPGAGDLIVSNWNSWVELLWLAYRCALSYTLKSCSHPMNSFDPVFVLPVPESVVQPATSTPSPISHTPGRRAGRTSMPEVSTSDKKPASQVPITGFHRVSLLTMLRETGRVPLYTAAGDATPLSLEEIRKASSRPVVVFPECTTSNGRGLLRFADLFRESLPVRHFNVFIMCVRYVVRHFLVGLGMTD